MVNSNKPRFQFRDFAWEYLFALCVIVVLLSLLFDFRLNFVHFEVFPGFFNCATKNGLGYTWQDLNLLLTPCFESGSPRMRFFSFLMWALNFKFQMVVFDWIPFHPTISMSSLLTIPLTAYFTFKLTYEWSRDRRLAILAGASILLSIGFLSNHLMFFWPAKPMGNLLFVWNWYICASIRRRLIDGEVISKALLWGWPILIFFSLFWDELLLGGFLFLAVLYFDIFTNLRTRRWALVVLAFFSVFLTGMFFWGIPYLYKTFSNFDYSVVEYAISSNDGLSSSSLSDFIFNLKSLVLTHIDFMNPPEGFDWGDIRAYNNSLIFVFLGFLIISCLKNTTEKWFHMRWWFASFIFFLFIHFLIQRRATHLFYGGAYWGSFASPIFVIAMVEASRLLSANKRRVLSLILFSLFAVAGFKNSYRSVMAHQRVVLNQYPFTLIETKPEIDHLSFYEVLEVWKNRHNLQVVKEKLKDYPKNGAWLYLFSYMMNPDLVSADPFFDLGPPAAVE